MLNTDMTKTLCDRRRYGVGAAAFVRLRTNCNPLTSSDRRKPCCSKEPASVETSASRSESHPSVRVVYVMTSPREIRLPSRRGTPYRRKFPSVAKGFFRFFRLTRWPDVDGQNLIQAP